MLSNRCTIYNKPKFNLTTLNLWNIKLKLMINKLVIRLLDLTTNSKHFNEKH